jgi:predicted enzyme related to lactoylglutathione lyase
MSAHVLGLGGVFLRANDPKALYQWYEQHFGLVRTHGCFLFQDDMRPEANKGLLTLSFFSRGDEHFPLAQPAMLNLRVADMDQTLAALAAAGVPIDPRRDDYDFGRFAWITDPEGNRIELWQPIPDAT